MKRNGFIGLIVIILTLLTIAILINKLYAKEPSVFTKESVKSITKYPKATNWQINDKPKLCIYYLNRCQETASTIIFTTEDSWAEIYEYYRTELSYSGWKTKSRIITSIPSSIILNNEILFEDTFCELVIKEKGANLFSIASKTSGSTFIIETQCLPT